MGFIDSILNLPGWFISERPEWVNHTDKDGYKEADKARADVVRETPLEVDAHAVLRIPKKIIEYTEAGSRNPGVPETR